EPGAVLPVVVDDDRLADVRLELQEVLDLLGRDVLPARRLDEVLLPVGDAQKSVGVELADVAGVEPSLGVPTLRGRLGPAVVSARDVRAAGQDLAVPRAPHPAALARQPHR